MASLQRLTLYGFFDSIERDLIRLIRKSSQSSDILNEPEKTKAKKALVKRGRDDVYNLTDDYDLLYGLDIGDKFSVLMRSKNNMDAASVTYFKDLTQSFQKAIPIRNDVMHGRQLAAQDHSYTYAFVQNLLNNPLRWPELAKFYREITNSPSDALKKSYDILEVDDVEETLHNLPIPDYDDTGFVRRQGLEKELKRKILGRHPVVTVLGDGGNGKSALALQTAYSLAQSQDHEFDAIAWVTAKSSVLTNQEIMRVEGALSSSLALFNEISDSFQESGADPTSRVMNLLSENAILLFIDNLETVIDDKMREFAESIPGKSKLVFTSRVPLGGDLTVKVDTFNDDEAITMIRRLAESYSIETLNEYSDHKLLNFSRKLGNKPLLIKWFSMGVLSGLQPQNIIVNRDLAIQYCLENVFDKLTDEATKISKIYSVIPNRLSLNEVEKISGMSAQQVESAIAELSRFSLITNDGSKAHENTYFMTDFARRYMGKIVGGASSLAKEINAEYRKLVGAFQNERSKGRGNRYGLSSYTVRSNQEALSVAELRRAFRLSKEGNFDDALKIVADQKILNSQYFEVYRVSASINLNLGDLQSADDDYSQAIEMAPEQPQLRAWYGSFLMIALADYEGAAKQYDEALKVDQSNFWLYKDAVRNQFYIPNFDRASELLVEAKNVKTGGRKSRTVLLDLECQLIIRQSEQLVNHEMPEDVINRMEGLMNILDPTGLEIADEILLKNVAKSRTVLFRAKNRATGSVKQRIEELERWITDLTD